MKKKNAPTKPTTPARRKASAELRCSALLACPFCGNKPKITREGKYENTEWRVVCEELWRAKCECHVQTKAFETRKLALMAWNTRKRANDQAHL